MWRVCVVAMALPVLGCHDAGTTTPDLAVADDLAGPPPVCTDPVAPDGGVAATLANVQRIFDEQCATCHFAGSGLVDLEAGRSWAALVGQPPPDPTELCGGTLVRPGDPANSYLYVKVSSDTPCYGQRMPRGEFGSVPLPDCRIDLIRRWILDGAPQN